MNLKDKLKQFICDNVDENASEDDNYRFIRIDDSYVMSYYDGPVNCFSSIRIYRYDAEMDTFYFVTDCNWLN